MEKILNDNFVELNNEKFEKNRPNIQNFNFNHNSITLLNGKLESFNCKLENFEDKNSSIVKELHLEHHLNFKSELNENSMLNLNTALHEGGYSLNINSDIKFKYPIIIYVCQIW